MSVVTHGMDTAAGLAASGHLETGAQEIKELATRLDALLYAFDWTGSDADRTRDSWQGVERPSLDTAAQHLTGLALLIRQEAEAQDATSDSGSGGAASSAGGTPVTLEQTRQGGIGAWLGQHLGAFFSGIGRTLDHAGGLVGKIGDVLTGKEDWSVAEIAASALATAGAGVGSVVNLVTGEDERWFGEGRGLAGSPVDAPTDPTAAGPFQPAVTRPTDLPSLMQGVADGYTVGMAPGSDGDVRITKVDNGTGTPAYIVAIPGTESWSPAAGGQPRDLSANLGLVAGNPTAAAESVRLAMDNAGIPAGSPVMFVGHSQGGIIAGQLASDPGIVERYGVTHVLTYGAPIDHMQLAPGVQALQIQHGNDWVPRLDLGGVSTSGEFPTPASTVTLDSPSHVFDPATNHSYQEYISSVREQMAAGGANAATLQQYQSTLAPFLVGPGGSATAVDVPVSRGD
ncbi:hypothetical protein [Nocardioides lijunqiniae]|uniref:hypothetical protein n=1 Tax=Nocardioides lijunqiniae TaxID=2760832 RepID=UPI00187879E8|nr:hypothetical protein [Nocardioides lijunqiniae]